MAQARGLTSFRLAVIRFTWKAATAKCTTCCSLGQQYVIHFSYARAASPASSSRTLYSRLLYLSLPLVCSLFLLPPVAHSLPLVCSRPFGHHECVPHGSVDFPRYGDAIDSRDPKSKEMDRSGTKPRVLIVVSRSRSWQDTRQKVYRMLPRFADKP